MSIGTLFGILKTKPLVIINLILPIPTSKTLLIKGQNWPLIYKIKKHPLK